MTLVNSRDPNNRDFEIMGVEHWRRQARPVLEEIRRLARVSGMSQRQVEERAGFSGGYLSQLLSERLDLKAWHVLAILDAIECEPGEFFSSVYPDRPRFPALRHFQETSQPLSQETNEVLGKLYGGGVESLQNLRRRLSRIEKAVVELESKGFLREES